VSLEFLDAKGNLVRRYATTDKPELSEQDWKTLAIPAYWVRMPRMLSAAAGMHRWVWDLRYPPPESLQRGYPISAVPHDTPRLPQGPSVLPGVHTVKLTAGGRSYTAPLTVKMDPRVKSSSAALQQKFEIETGLASMLTRSTEAVRQARSVEAQIEKLARDASGPMRETLEAAGKKIKAVLAAGRSGEPAPGEITLSRMNSQVSGLYGDLDSADTVPTVAQASAMDQIRSNFSSAMARWSVLAATEIAALNRELNRSNLPQIRLDEKPAREDDDEDQDLE